MGDKFDVDGRSTSADQWLRVSADQGKHNRGRTDSQSSSARRLPAIGDVSRRSSKTGPASHQGSGQSDSKLVSGQSFTGV